MNSIIDPEELRNDLDSLEKATLRLVCESILKIAPIAQEQFEPETRGMADSATGIQTWSNPSDRYSDLGEDLTRMALDNLGFSRVPDSRLFGAIDYKAARYVFLPEFAVEQALFVDSKAEKASRRTPPRMGCAGRASMIRVVQATASASAAESISTFMRSVDAAAIDIPPTSR